MKKLQVLIFLLLACFYVIKLSSPLLLLLLVILGLLFAALFNSDNENIVTTCLGVASLVTLELLLFEYVIPTKSETIEQVWVNSIIYGVHFIFDLTTLLFLMLRAPVLRFINAHKNHKYFITNTEFGLMTVFVMFLFVDLAAFVENLVRNLEHIGVAEETAKAFWDYNGIFYNYLNIKTIIQTIMMIVVFTTISKYSKEKFELNKRSLS